MSDGFHHRRRVEFSDTDAAGILHFTGYFRFMEEAESAFIRSLGLSVLMLEHDPPILWPRREVSFEYMRPSRFEDELDIHLRIAAREARTLTYEALFEKNGEKMARGRMTVVCCTLVDGQPKSVAIPDFIAERLPAHM